MAEQGQYALVIDTAFETCQVALAKDGALIACEAVISGGRHDHVLAGMVSALFSQHDITVKNLKQIIVTTGPGRFTGLRVGIAFARGLALVHDTMLMGVNTMDGIAFDLAHLPIPLASTAILVTVKRGESFLRLSDASAMIVVPDHDLIATLARADIIQVVGVITAEISGLLMAAGISVINQVREPSLDAIWHLGRGPQNKSMIVRPYYTV